MSALKPPWTWRGLTALPTEVPLDDLSDDELAKHVAELQRQRRQLIADVGAQYRTQRQPTVSDAIKGTARRRLADAMSGCKRLTLAIDSASHEQWQRAVRARARQRERADAWIERTRTVTVTGERVYLRCSLDGDIDQF